MMRDRTINMEARGLIIFSLLIAQALSAPNGCIEFCTGQQSLGSSYESSSSYKSHSKIVQGTNVQDVNHLNYEYRRPGNWTEHNEYVTDGGHGRVYEEKGQYVEGPKQVSYYRKDYSSSQTTGDLGGVDVLSRVAQVPTAAHTIDQEYEYDRQRHRQQIRVHPVQVVQPVSQTIHGQTHEEYSQHHASQTTQHGEIGSQIVQSQRPEDNWRVVDSHKTDGGHGQVYEEHGQYVNGPSKVRYYRRNYTASYGTPANTVVPIRVPVSDNLQRHVEDIQRQYEDLRRRTEHLTSVHDVSNSGPSIGLTQTGHHQQEVESVINTHVVPQPHIVRDEHSSENRYQKTTSRRVYGQTPVHTEGSTQQVVDRLVVQPQVYPTQNVYRKEHHSVVEGQYQPVVAQPVIYVPGDNAHNILTSTSHVDDRHRTETNLRQTSITSNSHLPQNVAGISSNSHLGQSVIGQHSVVYPAATTGHLQQYEEHWKSSGHVKGTTIPQSQVVSHSSLQNSGYGSEFRWVPSGQLTTGAIDLGHVSTHSVDCTDEAAEHVSRYHRLYKRNVKTGRRRAPVGNYFYDYRYRPTVPPTDAQQTQELPKKPEETQQQLNAFKPEYDYTQKPSKVEESFTQQTEDLQQHTGGFEDFAQGKPKDNEFEKEKLHNFQRNNQQVEDFGEHSSDLQQHTGGFDDFTQEPLANLEFGQHAQTPEKLQTTGNQHVEDFGRYDGDSQQHAGGFDDFTQQNEDLQQHTGGFDDFTQQTSGNLEFGQHTQEQQTFQSKPLTGNQHLEEFGQHSDGLEQQTGGFHDFSQQTSGNLEFGQHVTKPQIPDDDYEDVTVQSEDLQQYTGGFEDFTQQTSGNLEFGQHTQEPQIFQTKPLTGNQHLEDFGQHSDGLEQQTAGFHDFSQQTSGNLEFGQHTQKPENVNNQHVQDFEHYKEDTQQHTEGFDDFTQQTSGKLEFGQHNQKPQKLQTTTGNQHLEDFGHHDENLEQQTGGFNDYTQQTSGNLEFGQHSQEPSHLSGFTQQNEDLQQHTGGFEHFTQQTSGNLEFGQQTQQSEQHLDDYTQQTGGFDDFTQQTSGNLEFGQQQQQSGQHLDDFTQQNQDFQQHTGGFDDFTQQTAGNLELGHQEEKTEKPVICQSSICRKPAPKPAPKPTPKPRPGRGSRYGLEKQETSAHVQQQENTWQPHNKEEQQSLVAPVVEQVEQHNVGQENLRGDQLIHSSTEKATGKADESIHQVEDEQQVQQTNDWAAEWHQRHKPSDLTSEYTQQQSSVPDFSSQTHFNQDDGFSQQQQATLELVHDDQKQSGHYEQSQVAEEQKEGWQQQTDDAGIKTEPRILEAYGGSGPYDPTHDDNIFSRVTVNPSATLPPHVDREPWIVREKPVGVYYQPALPTTTPEPTTTTEAAPPSFWGRVGHRITSTFDKAKEKAKEVFG